MPKHLITLPTGTALPTDVSGLPEGSPYILDDGSGHLALHALRGGQWVIAGGSPGGGGGGGALPGGVLASSGSRVQLSSGAVFTLLAQSIQAPRFGVAPPAEVYYDGGGMYAVGAADAVTAVHFEADVTGFDPADATAVVEVEFNLAGGYVHKKVRVRPESNGHAHVDTDFVVRGGGSQMVVPIATLTFASGTPGLDSWKVLLTPIAFTPYSPPVVHSVDVSDFAFSAPNNATSPSAGTVHVTWRNLPDAVAADSIHVHVEWLDATGATNRIDAPSVAGTATSVDITGAPSGTLVGVNVSRTRNDGAATCRDFLGLVTVT